MTRQDVVLVGANPFVRLFDGGQVSALVSIWRVDWSPHGTGTAAVVWYDGKVRRIGRNAELTRWVADAFTANFTEAAGLAWPDSDVEDTDVDLHLDLDTGMTVRAGDITVEMTDVLGRRTARADAMDLGGTPHGLSLVIAPTRRAEIRVGDTALPGEPQVDETGERPSSSAFLSEAEVWTTDAA